MHTTRLIHGPQLQVSGSAGYTTRWPLTEPCYYTFEIWTFPRATKRQRQGHFWPLGHGLYTPDLENATVVS